MLAENKELVVGPALTLIPQLFSLPYFVASLMARCQNLQESGLRYLLMISYFTTYIPQLMSFVLYISPSSFYSQEWQATDVGKWVMAWRRGQNGTPPMTRLTNMDGRTR